MKVAMLQLNFTVGDLFGNTEKIIKAYKEAVSMGADIAVTSELAIFGYPPKDMLLYESFLNMQSHEIERLQKEVGEVGLIVGIAEKNFGNGKPLFNSAVLIRNGEIILSQKKSLLPTYDVFDESRYFEPGNNDAAIFEYNGSRCAILICEDIWNGDETLSRKLYKYNPVEKLKNLHLDNLFVINGSPYYLRKGTLRFNLVKNIASKLNCNVIYVNQVGGNDDLVFDGRSFAMCRDGFCIAASNAFEENIVIADTESCKWSGNYKFDLNNEDLYNALVLGTRDYVQKTGFEKALIGLSGGIDSALTACIAVDALGKENVLGVAMPSKFSSKGSLDDARRLSDNLGIALEEIPIGETYNAFEETLKHEIGWYEPGSNKDDVTEENIQARIRGIILMAISNRTEGLVLSTGNKSEISVGYCTLYGDMAGGFAVISDLWKTQIYQLAKFVNERGKGYIIPKNTLEKPPSAELSPDQKDIDSLPPYDVLDPILKAYIEEQKGLDEIAGEDEKPEKAVTVRNVIEMVNRAEHKRKQMPLGLKISSKAFGSGRRWPIAAKNL